MKGLIEDLTPKEKEWISIDCDLSVYEKLKDSIGKKLMVNILGIFGYKKVKILVKGFVWRAAVLYVVFVPYRCKKDRAVRLSQIRLVD